MSHSPLQRNVSVSQCDSCIQNCSIKLSCVIHSNGILCLFYCLNCLFLLWRIPKLCTLKVCAGRVQLKSDGTWWCMGGEVKGKQVNGVGSQYSYTLPQNMVYPALLPTTKTYDKLPSSTVSRELSSKIRQFQHHCFHVTFNLLLTWWVQLFPVLWYDLILFVCPMSAIGMCYT